MTTLKKIARTSLYTALIVGGLYAVALCGKDNEGFRISYFTDTGKGIGLSLDNRGFKMLRGQQNFSNYVERTKNLDTNIEVK